jgi:FkbM family methyltransferase
LRALFLLFPKVTGPLRSFYNLYFGEREILYFYNYLKSYKNNYIFIDIGANYGIYTFLFGKHSKITYVLEPVKDCLEYIKRGYRFNNIKTYNKVASDNNKAKTLNIPLVKKKPIYGRSSINSKFEDSKKILVESLKIDNLKILDKQISENLIFIKIDVEGHENFVVSGGKQLLNTSKTVLLIEVEERHNQNYISLFQELLNYGFSIFYLENQTLVRIKDLNNLKLIMKTNINFIFKNY